MVDEYQQLLTSSNLHPTLDAQFNRFLLYLKGRTAIGENNLALAQEILNKLQSQPVFSNPPSPLPDVQELQYYVVLAKNDAGALSKLYLEEQLRLSDDTPTCTDLYFQYQLALRLQNVKMYNGELRAVRIQQNGPVLLQK